MHKNGADLRVKKTFVRNVEEKVQPTARKKVIHDVGSASLIPEQNNLQTNTELNEPTLCSSELLANYLSTVKNSLPTSVPNKDLEAGPTEIRTKITKKLNFNFNDKIYKNLVELNANLDDMKTKREKRSSSVSRAKKDLEPNIEDFFEEEIDSDSAPDIPVIKPKFKPIWRVENGELHRLVASFDNL